jgi:molybdate transport system regulatory protein
MQTSARNNLSGKISHITPGAVNSEVTIDLGHGVEIVSILTRRSVERLGLAVGAAATALVKASFVILALGEGLKTSARNHIPGVVTSRDDGVVDSEVTLDIGAGKSLTAILTIESAKALGIKEGLRMTALIKAPHVIVAVE